MQSINSHFMQTKMQKTKWAAISPMTRSDQSSALTCAFIGIFPTHSHDTPFTMASCGTTVAGIRNFSTRVQFAVPVG